MSFYSEITDLILSKKIQSREELHRTKIKLCKKYKIDNVPPNSEILARLPFEFSDEEKEAAITILRKKPMRTISGVAIVAAMTSPEECPHGRCVPCPGGPDSNTPQSYTGYEPATMRALMNDFDPFLQTKSRLEQLEAIGHSVDKIDFIIMGGTFTARSPFYQEWFVKRCFDALNNFESKNLEQAKKINEKAKSRCIGLTVETRPDWFRLRHADQALYLGATRVELGIQTVYDDILYKINRGHNVSDSIMATRIAKDAGLKVTYHMMPNLLGSNYDRDINAFKKLFQDNCFKPDALKIYPTLVLKGTKLYQMLRKGEYTAYPLREVVKLISEVKKMIPKWVRIQRVQRDIPSNLIVSGVKKSNLRQIVQEKIKEQGIKCRCIRCREVGHVSLKEKIEIDEGDIDFDCDHYEASGGEEFFVSIVDKKHDALIGYLRLRNIVNSHRFELINRPCMIIRELKVLGREIPIGQKNEKGWQHRGYGKELINEAERICLEKFDKKLLFVLSGIGVKEYYRKLGFKDNGVYLRKQLHG